MELLCKETVIGYLKEKGNYEMIGVIESGLFDHRDYQKLSIEFVGKMITDNYCNGFFGTDGGLLDGLITEVRADNDGHKDFIEVTVVKATGYYSKAYFVDSWNDWKAVYELLECWVAQ